MDFKQTEPWHTIVCGFAPTDLKSSGTALGVMTTAILLLDNNDKHIQHPCNPLLHTELGDWGMQSLGIIRESRECGAGAAGMANPCPPCPGGERTA